MHPEDRTLTREYQSVGTFAMGQGDPVDGDTQLMPWIAPGDKKYTSKNVVDVASLGYSYPDLPSGGSAEERRKQVTSVVNKLYGRDSDKGNDNASTDSSSASTTESASAAPSSTDAQSTTESATDSSQGNARFPATPSSAYPSQTGEGDEEDDDSPFSLFSGLGSAGGKQEDKKDGLPGLDDLTNLGQSEDGKDDKDDGFNITDLFPPIPDDLIPDLPDLDIGIDLGIEYMIRISVQAGKIPTPSEMNVYIGEKFAGSFVVLVAPSSGCFEGEFPIRKVLDVLGLLTGLISDLIHGKIQNPIDAIKDDIHVEFTHVCVPPPPPPPALQWQKKKKRKETTLTR